MSQDWATLNESERATVSTVLAFLHKRLAEPTSIDWALRLDPTQRLERFAVLDLLGRQGMIAMPEPWATAWRLIEECWSTEPKTHRLSFRIYDIQKKLQSGDRTGPIVRAIVEIVAPRLEVKPISSEHWRSTRKLKKPKSFHDMLSAKLTSDKLIDLNLLGLDGIVEIQFLNALANGLEVAIANGLEIARRVGWDGARQWWKVGLLHSVYYRQPHQGETGGHEPDAYNEGIAPSVKLLHAVVARIAAIDVTAAKLFMQRWKLEGSSIHLRLWAAMARNLSPSQPSATSIMWRSLLAPASVPSAWRRA